MKFTCLQTLIWSIFFFISFIITLFMSTISILTIHIIILFLFYSSSYLIIFLSLLSDMIDVVFITIVIILFCVFFGFFSHQVDKFSLLTWRPRDWLTEIRDRLKSNRIWRENWWTVCFISSLMNSLLFCFVLFYKFEGRQIKWPIKKQALKNPIFIN